MMLTKREVEIAELFSWGYTEKEVAAELCLSVDTVHTHKKRILTKTASHNTVMLSRWYFANIKGAIIGMPPAVKRITAICLLALVIHAEFANLNYLRTRAAYAKKVVVECVRAARKVKEVESLTW